MISIYKGFWAYELQLITHSNYLYYTRRSLQISLLASDILLFIQIPFPLKITNSNVKAWLSLAESWINIWVERKLKITENILLT